MRRYWAILIGLFVALALIALPAFKSGRREPSYDNQSLSYWLDELAPPAKTGPYSWLETETKAQGVERYSRARKAIESFGPEAVPFLLNKVRQKHSLRQRWYGATWQKIPSGLRGRLPPPRQFQNYGSPNGQVVSAVLVVGSNAVPRLITALTDYNSDVQITAMAALGSLNPDPYLAIPTLTNLASHANGFVRRWAILTIGRMGPSQTNVLDTLLAALNDNDLSPLPGSSARVRETAADLLGQLGPQAQIAVPALQQLLTDADDGVRQEAAIALWRISGDRSVLPTLVEELKKRQNVKKLIAVLGEMGPIAKPAVPAIKDALGPFWTRAVQLAPSKTTETEASLLSAEPHLTLGQVVGDALRRIDPDSTKERTENPFPQATPLTVNGGGSGMVIVGQRSAWTMMDRSSIPALTQLLDNPNPETRIEALLTLGRLGWKPDRESVPLLTRLLTDRNASRYRGLDDPDIGREFVYIGDLAVELLGHGGADAQPAVASLAALLEDPYWNTRPYVPLAIWRISKDTNVLQHLISNLRNAGSARVYRRFLAAAAEMGEAAKPAVPAILRGHTNFTEDLTLPVQDALSKIDPKAAPGAAKIE